MKSIYLINCKDEKNQIVTLQIEYEDKIDPQEFSPGLSSKFSEKIATLRIDDKIVKIPIYELTKVTCILAK